MEWVGMNKFYNNNKMVMFTTALKILDIIGNKIVLDASGD